jgi:hypothetical protein
MFKSRMALLPIIAVVFASILAIGCQNPLPPSSIPLGTEFDKYGGVSLSTASTSKAVQGAAEYFYITALDNGVEHLYRFASTGGDPEAKYVMFDGSGTPPAANPDVFTIGGVEHLLFAWGNGNFTLYRKGTEDDTHVYFTGSALFDFSAITAEVQTHAYSSPAWVLCPEYNDTRKTLYFTLAFWVQNAAKGDYIKVRIWQSMLTENAFGAPTMTQGEIDPFNNAHYAAPGAYDEDSFSGRNGLWWIGRLYMTDDGTKAYFNVLNIMRDSEGIMNAGDAYIAPKPNNQDYSGFPAIDDVYHPSLIRNYICEADVDAGGNFYNITRLSSTVNTQGVNFVSDITGDGGTIYVSHMDVDEDFWPYRWGADGLALELCQKSAVVVEPWIGYIIIYTRTGGVWSKTGSIGEEAADTHTPKYLENLAKLNSYLADPDGFLADLKAVSPWIPATTTMNPDLEHGIFRYKLNDVLPTVQTPDANVLGDWVVCDFVPDIAVFDPLDPYWSGSFFWTAAQFISDYSMKYAYDGGVLGSAIGDRWTYGTVKGYNGVDMNTASTYVIINYPSTGLDYLFVEWKSGDYSIRASKPSYYVFERP